MACSTSMIGVIEAAGMIDGRGRDLALVGGVESMSKVQVGASIAFSDWLKGFQAAKTPARSWRH
jgi:acetyl-CoA C-acetyltransferase